MAVYTNAGGGGGAGSDECTAAAGDVLKGKTYVGADTDDEAGTGTLALTGTAADSQVLSGQTYYNTDAKTKRTGTMANQGAKTAALNAGGSYTIPAGYHNGAGKVTANALSGQTSGNAAAADIRKSKTAWVNGAKVTGNMTEQGGSTTTPGTANKTIVAANRYVTGNIIVAGASTLVAANIKKNVTIFGVKGTFEGWVPTATDLYYNGVNSANLADDYLNHFTFENTRIKFMTYGQSQKIYSLKCPKAYDVKSFSKLNFQGRMKPFKDGEADVTIQAMVNGKNTILAGLYNISGVKTTISLDISQLTSIAANWVISFDEFTYVANDTSADNACYINRIWFS